MDKRCPPGGMLSSPNRRPFNVVTITVICWEIARRVVFDMVLQRWTVLILLILLPAASAGMVGEAIGPDPAGSLSALAEDTMDGAHEGATETWYEARQDAQGTAHAAHATIKAALEDGHRQASDRQHEAEGEAGTRQGQVEDEAAPILEAASKVVADPVGFLEGGVVRPAEDRVQSLSEIVVFEPEAQEDEEAAAPASVAVEAQGMPASVPYIVAGVTAAAAGAVFFWLAGSSGAVGGAGAGAGAKVAGSELRRVLPYASPLFTRFEKDTVMGHPKREQIYALIVDEPGVPLQRLCDKTGLSRTAVTHHLRLLEHHHIVVSRRVGRSRHYYENGGRYGREQKEAYAVLQNDRSRQVAEFIRENPGAIQKRLCAALGLQASIAHWHVRRLQEASLVECVREGRTVSYFPTSAMQTIS